VVAAGGLHWAAHGKKGIGPGRLLLGFAQGRNEKVKEKGRVGQRRMGPRRFFEKFKGFSISYFDSNSNSIRISNEFYRNLKLKHSIKSKQSPKGMMCNKQLYKP
jgi:hypothetical protein